MTTNSAELKPFPCPFCGKASDLEDHDTLYPTGTYWRDDKEIGMRTYHGWRDRKDGDTTCWRMHCPVPSGGCGAEIGADSKDEAIAAWNRRTAAQGEQSKACSECKGTGLGGYVDHGAAIHGNGAIEPVRCDSCAGFGKAGSAEQVSEREAFEKWVSDSGRAHLLERDKQHNWYKDLTVTAWWSAWLARAALSAPERKVMTDSELPPLPVDMKATYWSAEYGVEPIGYTADQMREYALALLDQQGEQTAPEWQPIETAPRDELLLLAAEFDRPGDWRIKVGGYWEGEWHVFGSSWTPTRWMRLPAAPSTAQKE